MRLLSLDEIQKLSNLNLFGIAFELSKTLSSPPVFCLAFGISLVDRNNFSTII